MSVQQQPVMLVETEELQCPICGCSSRIADSFSDVRLHRCPCCKHCFTDINCLYSLEEYSPEYYEDRHRNWFNNPDTALFEIIYRMLPTRRGAAVLDVGCGTGHLLRYLRGKNSELTLTGIDFANNLPDSGIEYLEGDFLQLGLDRKYDCVVSTHVIEHSSDPRVFVQKLNALCTENGVVIVTTINEAGLLYRLARLLNRIGYKSPFQRLYSKHHLNHFSEGSLRKLMETNGLQVLDIRHHNAPLEAIDFEASSATMPILKLAVAVIFLIGGVLRSTYLQTALCRKC